MVNDTVLFCSAIGFVVIYLHLQ